MQTFFKESFCPDEVPAYNSFLMSGSLSELRLPSEVPMGEAQELFNLSFH